MLTLLVAEYSELEKLRVSVQDSDLDLQGDFLAAIEKFKIKYSCS